MSRRSSLKKRRGTWDVAGVHLAEPIIVGSGPLTSKLSLIKRADKAGAGGVSLKLTFVKLPFESEMRSYSRHDNVILSPAERRLAINEGTTLCRSVKKETRLAVWANYSASKMDDWMRLTDGFADAGADGLELNFCCPNLDTSYGKGGKKSMHGGAPISADIDLMRRIVTEIRKHHPKTPILPKIVSNVTTFKESVVALAELGVNGVHVVGGASPGAPPLNPETLRPDLPFAEGVSFGSANGPINFYSTLRVIAVTRAAAPKLHIVASGGISDWKDCVSAYAYGADAVAICSAIMWHGWERLTRISIDLKAYFERKGFSGPNDIKGKALEMLVPPSSLGLPKRRARIDAKACIGCGRCAKVGHCEAITITDRKACVDEARCISCGVCRSLCPTNAIIYDDDPRY